MTDKQNTNDIALDLIDFYIKHYEKLGKKGLAGAFRELQTDINNALGVENAEEFGNDKRIRGI